MTPDALILRAASARLADRMGERGLPSWRVIEASHRERSTIFRLATVCGGRPVNAYYKTDEVDDALSPVLRTAEIDHNRHAMDVERMITGPLVDALHAESVTIADPLVLDPQSLTAVRLAVPGDPLGRTLRHLSGRPGRAKRTFRTIGRALRVIHHVASQYPVTEAIPTVEGRLWRDLDRAQEQLTSRQLSEARSLITELQKAGNGGRLVYTHGDVSGTNVLLDGEAVGLIDFAWQPEIAYHDLAYFVCRVETDSPRIPALTKPMVHSVFEGFGLDRFDPEPEWRLAYVQRALKAMRKAHPRSRAWGRRVLRDLIARA